jgi:hypothetical protein
VTDFGDYEPDDAYDPAPADPEQVARKIHTLRREVEDDLPAWEDLDPVDQERKLLIAYVLLEWLRRQGSMP